MQILVKNNEIIGYSCIGNFIGGIEIDKFPDDFESNFKPSRYIFVNGKIECNPNYVAVLSENTIESIDKLKAALNKSDYKITKYQEYILAGIDPPEEYDIQQIHSERQSIRNEINKLENQL